MRCWRVCFIALLLAPSAFAENFQKQADEFWMRAYTLQKAGKYDEAIALYDQSLAAERRSAQPRQAKMALTLELAGFCYNQRNQTDNALASSQKALEIYRKLGDDKKIANLLNGIGKLHARIDQYEQAAAAHQEAMELARKIGQEPTLAAALANLASVLRKQGKYAEALTLYDESLAINTRLNRQGEIVTLLGNIGVIHQEQGNYQQARQEFEDALALSRQIGEQAGIAVALTNLGILAHKRQNAEEALRLLTEALALRRELGRAADIADCLNNIGSAYRLQGEYEEAAAKYGEALALYEQIEQPSGVAIARNNLGEIYREWGRYDMARQAYERAMEIAQRIKRDDLIAVFSNNLGALYDAWGEYRTAFTFYQKSLEIERRLGRQREAATRLSNMGHALYWLKEYRNAATYFQQAADIETTIFGSPGLTTLNNLASVAMRQGQYDAARSHFDHALRLARASGDLPSESRFLQNIGKLYYNQGDVARAIEITNEALTIARRLNRAASMASMLNNLGAYHIRLERFREAIPFLEESVALKEALRKTVDAGARRAYLAEEAHTYRFLAFCYVKLGDFENAFRILELSQAKRLRERLRRERDDAPLPSLKAVQAALAPEAAIVMYSEAPDEQLLQLLITDSGVKAAIRDLRQFAMNAPQDAQAASAALPTETRGLRINGASDTEEPLASSSANFSKMIEQYRGLLTFDESDGRGLQLGNQQAAETPVAQDDTLTALSKRFYALMFDQSMRDALRGKSRLIIVPDGLLNTLPFETLRDENGRYAVERYDISYAPSVAVLEIVRQRRYPADRRPLLAFGGAVYQPETYRRDIAENAAQVAYLQRQADKAFAANVPPSRVYDWLDLLWINLPGTLAEAQALGKVVKHAKIVTGEAVSERAVKKWSREGKLAEYRRIHFATHGIAIPKIGELSAIVLSLSPNATRDEDGYLNIPEILGLEIKADAVTLSACETALGQLFQGEGTVGLIQAFLIAGANGVSASLWQVADDSTAAFMVAYYRLLDDYQGDDARAISEIKRRFLRGEFGKEWAHPFFWAPFAHYGK